MIEPAAQPMRRTGHRGVDIASADREGADQVGFEPFMDQRTVGPQRCLRVNDGRQFLEIAVHQFGCVFRLVTAFGDNDGNRLTDVAYLVVRKEWLARTEEFVLDERDPFAGH
jgi:hypothetical protein